MGYMRHHAIVVTGWGQAILDAQEMANSIFDNVSPIIRSEANGYDSFFIPPDGSKEGWDESNAGNKRRDDFIGWLRVQSWVKWVEVQYGDDDGVTRITRHSDEHGVAVTSPRDKLIVQLVGGTPYVYTESQEHFNRVDSGRGVRRPHYKLDNECDLTAHPDGYWVYDLADEQPFAEVEECEECEKCDNNCKPIEDSRQCPCTSSLRELTCASDLSWVLYLDQWSSVI